MEESSWDIHTVSEEWLVEFCEQLSKKKETIGGCVGGDSVVKLSENIAAKFGYGVTASEAKTQEFVHRNVDANIVHIPRVYRYFQREDSDCGSPKGYLFMECIPGKLLEEVDLDQNVDIIPRVAKIVAHLGTIREGQVPGPLDGGKPRGYLWGDDGARTTFTCVEDMEAWLNKRLSLRDKSIDLSSSSLVLCHMDLCRRNMILKENNTICLLDWGYSGLYPRFFELATFDFLNPYDEAYQPPLKKATSALLGWTKKERELVRLMELARAVAMRYSFETENKYGIPDWFHDVPPPPPLPSQSPHPSTLSSPFSPPNEFVTSGSLKSSNPSNSSNTT